MDNVFVGTDNTNLLGRASVSYNIPAGTTLGDHTIRAEYAGTSGSQPYDSATDTGTLRVNPINHNTNTDLTLSHNSATQGNQINLNAHLTYSATGPDPPLAGQTIIFSVEGTDIGSNTTDTNGYAHYAYTASTTGSDLDVRARFGGVLIGTNYYQSSSETQNLDVFGTSTSLTVNPTTTTVNSPVTLTSRLTYTGGSGINGQTIHFFVDGVEVGSDVADWSGIQMGWASFTYTPITSGIKSIQAIFYGSLHEELWGGYDYSRSSSATQPLTVNGIPTTLTVNSPSGYNGTTVPITATLTRTSGGAAISGAPVTITANGQTYTANTNGAGQITWNFLIDNMVAGGYPIQASYAGNGTYVASNGAGTLTVIPSANISVTKTVNNTRPNVGDTIRYIVTVRNNGLDTATEVNILDQLPSDLTYVGSGWIDYFNIQNANVGVPNTVFHTMYTGGYGIYYIDALVNPSAAGHTIVNYANKTAEDQYDPNTTNDNSSASIYVPAVDVYVNKWTSDGTIWNYLTQHYFFIDVRNLGPDDATNVVVVETLQPGFDFISTPNVPGVWDPVARTVTWTFSTLTAGGPVRWCDIIVRVVDSNTTIGNTVTVTADQFDLFPGNNTDSMTITVPPAANVDLTKEFRQTLDGSAITQANYHDIVWAIVSAHNKGPDAATVTITDTPSGFTPNSTYTVSYDNGLTWAGADGSFTGGVWTINIPDGLTYLLAIQGTVDQTGTVNNTAEQTAQDIYHSEQFESVTASLTVPSAVDIVVDKFTNDGTTWNYGTEHSFLIDVWNNGPDNATNVVVVETLQSGFDFVSASNGGVWDSVARTVTWTFANLSTGLANTEHCNILVRVTSSNTTIGNTATATATEHEWNLVDNTDSMAINVPLAADIAVTKEFRTDYPNSTNTTTTANYHTPIWAMVHVTNSGPDTVADVQVTDKLPVGLTYQNMYFVSYDGGATWTVADTYNATTGVWNIGNMLNGADYWLAILAHVDGHNETIENNATETQATYDQNHEDNVGRATLAIPPAADVFVNTSISKNNPTVGEEVVVRVKVGNNGPDGAQNVIVTYKIPAGMEFVSLTQEAGYPVSTYDPATRTVTWNLGDLAIIDPWMDITLRAVSSGATSSDAIVTSDTYDPVSENNVSAVAITVEQAQVNAATVPMQPTGIPIAGLVLAVLMLTTGLVIPKRK